LGEVKVRILKKVSLKSIDFYVEQNLDDFYAKSSKQHILISHIENKVSWVLFPL
jgi:hypothetical protein